MGGDHSQKLLPRRGILLLSGAQPPAHYEFNTVAENCAVGNSPSPPSPDKPDAVVAQLQTAWVILGKQTWVISPARRSRRACG